MNKDDVAPIFPITKEQIRMTSPEHRFITYPLSRVDGREMDKILLPLLLLMIECKSGSGAEV